MEDMPKYGVAAMCGAPDNPIKINIKKTNPKAIIPARQTEMAIGYDLAIPEDTVIPIGRTVVKLGFAVELPFNIEAKIEPRSGFSAKGMEGYEIMSDTRCKNGEIINAYFARIDEPQRFDADVIVGKIDPDYRGEVGVIIRNYDNPFMLKAGTRVAQMTFYKVETADFAEVEELSETKRADGGFESTGSH